MPFLVVPLLALGLAAAPGDSARDAFESGTRALATNDLAAAERSFRHVLKLQPGHVGALGNLGVVYSRMGRFADAVDIGRRALKFAPADPQLNLNVALAYLKQDNYESSKSHLKKVLAARPDHAQARELLATAQLFTGELSPATETLESLQSTGNPSVPYLLSIAYLKQKRKEDARAAVAQLFASVPPAQAHLLAGRAYYESTLFEEALTELLKARELAPDLPAVSRELGKTYVSLRRAEDAKTALEQALKADPADAEARYFRGALLVQEGSLEAGVEHLELARAARPEFWGSYYYLGRAALAAGRPADAARLLRRASDLRPDDTTVLYQLARALKAAGKNAESQRIGARLTEIRSRARQAEQEALVSR
jgi:tetratricopeptide (TPR) repeat protein